VALSSFCFDLVNMRLSMLLAGDGVMVRDVTVVCGMYGKTGGARRVDEVRTQNFR
jgi:hypothetical protein